MLATLRYCIARPNFKLRGCLAAFHTSAPKKRDDPIQEYIALGETFKQESASTTATNFVANPNTPFREFRPNHFINPYRLTYDSVRKRTAQPKTRPRVGPSKREAQFTDPFHSLRVDPLKQATNPAMFMPFLTEMGKVNGRNVTNLTKKSQRRVGKAIRRAKMMGILPTLNKRNIFHPVSSYL